MCRLSDEDVSSDIVGADEWLRVPEATYKHLLKKHPYEFTCREELRVTQVCLCPQGYYDF